jgi:hypothetical protein
MAFKVIIAGSRGFNDYNFLKEKCNKILSQKNPNDVEIISGNAVGADAFGCAYAEENKYSITLMPANWARHGKAAGMIRNQRMADYADSAIVFWDGKSSGTKNMIDLAKKNKMPVRVIKYE